MKNTLLIAGFSLFGLAAAHAGSCGGGGKSSSSNRGHDHSHSPKTSTVYRAKPKTSSRSYAYSKSHTSSKTSRSGYSVSHAPLLSASIDPKGDFLKRLATAPRGGQIYDGCSIRLADFNDPHRLDSMAHAALSCSRVEMLGKVEYGTGETWLGDEARHQIQNAIFAARGRFSPNTLAVVFGFADRNGDADMNLRLSHSRALNVQKFIDQLNWSHGLHLQTTSVAMGEEVELCRHHLDHNRVAEIWLIELPVPATQMIRVIEPSMTATQVLPAPAPMAPQQIVSMVPNAPAPPFPAVQRAVPAPVAVQPVVLAPANPTTAALNGLIDYLSNNMALLQNADRVELGLRLEALRAAAQR